MNKFFAEIKNEKYAVIKYILAGLFIQIANSLVISYSFKNSTELLQNPILKKSFSYQLILGVIIGPLVETYLCQKLIIDFVSRKLNSTIEVKMLVSISLSTIIFAALHSYSWLYQLAMVVPAFLFAYGYWQFQSRGKSSLAFWLYLSCIPLAT